MRPGKNGDERDRRGSTADEGFEPDVAAFLQMAGAGSVPLETLGVAEARDQYRVRRANAQLAPLKIGKVIEDSVAGRGGLIPVRRYLPARKGRAAKPAILFFHGGGWVVGDLDTHDSLCRHVVHATGLQLIAVDYRLAPEQPFPAAVEDAVDAHAMLVERAAAWGVDPQRIAVMGDSAGATLASVVSLHARDMCLPIPLAQLLFYPITDMLEESDSFRRIRDLPLTGDTLRWFRSQYLPDDVSADDWRLSPLRARSLSGLPPTFIAVAGHDPLRDEGIAFAARLYTAGVVVALRELPGQIHGYLMLGRFVGEAGRSIAAAADFLGEQLKAGATATV